MEFMKASVRLALFRDSGYQMLLQGGEVQNVKKLPEVTGDHQYGPGQLHYLNGQITPSLEGRAMAALNRFGYKARMASDGKWFKNSFYSSPPQDVSFKKLTLSTILSQKGVYGISFVMGEVLSILRPLFYVLSIRKHGTQAWKPWFLSLVVELTGLSFLYYGINSGGKTGDKHYELSIPEKDEIKRRKLMWALYIMRDPFFTKYTKHRLEKTDKYLSHVPFFGILTGKIIELLVGAQTRYTYTSGS